MFNFFDLELPTLITRVITLMIAFTIHELSHALVAHWLGDDTAKEAGRITLNPVAHIDPVGAIMLVLMGFGWAKATPINPAQLKRRTPAGVALVSLAGPISNLILAGIAAIFLRVNPELINAAKGDILPSLGGFLTSFFLLNIVLAVFNLIPIAPLDGDKILEFLLPASWSVSLDSIRPVGSVMLMVAAFLLPRFGVNIFSILLDYPIQVLIRFFLPAG